MYLPVPIIIDYDISVYNIIYSSARLDESRMYNSIMRNH